MTSRLLEEYAKVGVDKRVILNRIKKIEVPTAAVIKVLSSGTKFRVVR
jgi:hypothetical protein